jgi:hypothetical protein
MTDAINQRYGITDEAIEAEVQRLLPVLRAWGEEDTKVHPFTPLSDEAIAARRARDLAGKASAALEGIYPTAAEEALHEVFHRLRWDGDKRRRYINAGARQA